MESEKTSYRPVRVIGALLILEVIGLVLLGGYEFLQVDWRYINVRTLQPQAVELVVFALFIPSAILTLLSALSFLFLYRRGWQQQRNSGYCGNQRQHLCPDRL